MVIFLLNFSVRGSYEGLLYIPNETDIVPLVVIPHGGPHSVTIAWYIIPLFII